MFRTTVALVLLLASATVAPAQPFGSRRPAPLPLSPGVMPGSPIGPGTQFLPPQLPVPPRPGMGGFRHIGGPVFGAGAFGRGFYAYPGLGYGFGGFGYGGFGYGYGDYGFGGGPLVEVNVASPPPVFGGSIEEPRVALANEFAATLTLQFPAPAEVWLDGKKVPGEPAEERVLTSPVLKQGDAFTFRVKARWASGGKTYEAKREVTLGSAARSRLLVVSGDEVKE